MVLKIITILLFKTINLAILANLTGQKAAVINIQAISPGVVEKKLQMIIDFCSGIVNFKLIIK